MPKKRPLIVELNYDSMFFYVYKSNQKLSISAKSHERKFLPKKRGRKSKESPPNYNDEIKRLKMENQLLQDLRALGYDEGKSILKDYIRLFRPVKSAQAV